MDVLAIDGGKTKTLFAVYRDGCRGDVVKTGGLENIAAAQGLSEIRDTLRSVICGELPRGPWDAVSLGVTGVHGGTPHADTMLDILAEFVDASRLLVASDVVTTYCGAMGFRPGAVVAAGTGSIALGLVEGRSAVVDGWGYLLGDEGSGFSIGRAGLRSALRHFDGRGGSRALLARAVERFGSVDHVLSRIYGADLPPAAVAAFSREVAIAAQEGDEESRRIWGDAARSLAEMVVAAAGRVTDAPEVQLSYSGGLFGAQTLLLAPFREELRRLLPQADLVAPRGDALDGAALLSAGEVPTLVESIVSRRDVG
jgi:glucosamine kinase